MQTFAGLSMLLVGIATLAIGIRLLWLASRTRQVPELGYGIGFVAGSLGTALAQIGQRVIWADAGTLATGMNAFCFALSVIGTWFLYLVVWKVFRPASTGAAAFALLGSMLAAVAWGIRLGDGSFVTANIQEAGVVLLQVDRFVLFAWSAYEAGRQSLLLRRRARIGLADPVATLQIGLWSVAATALLPVTAIIIAFAAGYGRHPLETFGTTLVLTLLSSVSTLAMWFAFFPPRWLQRRVEARNTVPA